MGRRNLDSDETNERDHLYNKKNTLQEINILVPRKTNMDTQNDGLEKVVPFKYGHFWYPC